MVMLVCCIMIRFFSLVVCMAWRRGLCDHSASRKLLHIGGISQGKTGVDDKDCHVAVIVGRERVHPLMGHSGPPSLVGTLDGARRGSCGSHEEGEDPEEMVITPMVGTKYPPPYVHTPFGGFSDFRKGRHEETKGGDRR